MSLDIQNQLLGIIDEALGLEGRGASFDHSTPLMGGQPELDSMAVIGLINLIEERFGFFVGEDEVDGATFETVGTLLAYVKGKLGKTQY
ncbi:acyl carrier protein [Thauera sp.]|uniref:acyl carrier protein n=1 Tax=Thauera sp. TaxID=1905334 RepID=UPI0039E51747